MVTLKIDNDEATVGEQVTFLQAVTRLLEKGFTSGESWEITRVGKEEDNEDDE